MRSCTTRSVKRNGPAQIGLATNLSPASFTAFGLTIMPARSVSCAISGENGALSERRTVSGSATSTLSICDSSALRNEPCMVMWRSSVNLTASASNGSPSWNFTPGRSLMVTVLPSSDVSCDERELRHDVELRVDVEQLVAHRGEHDAPDIGTRGGRIEIVGILGKADAQVALRGGGRCLRWRTRQRARGCELSRSVSSMSCGSVRRPRPRCRLRSCRGRACRADFAATA